MIQLLFVNELRDDNTRLQECRSHAARIDHRRRRQRRADDQMKLALTSSTYYSGENAKLRMYQSPIWMQPRCPLMLGPRAAPAAVLDGHESINFYVTRARSKLSFITPAFNMSSMHSRDWAEFMANSLLYHAGAAFVHRLLERTPEPSRNVLEHRGKAIEAVREHLTVINKHGELINPHAIAGVVMLAALDEMLGDLPSHNLHRTMLGVLMECRGQPQDLEYDPIYFFVSEAEMDWCSRTGYSVLKYQANVRQKTKLTRQIALDNRSKFATLPAGFRALIAAETISVESAETVATMAIALKGRQREYRSQQDPMRQDYFQVFPYLHPDYPEILTFDDLVELALLLFCSHTIVPYDPGLGTTYAARKKLAENLPTYLSGQPQLPETEMKTLLWIGMLTLYAWEHTPQDAQFGQVPWLLLDLPLGVLATWSGEEVQNLLKGYFWTEAFVKFGRHRWESISST